MKLLLFTIGVIVAVDLRVTGEFVNDDLFRRNTQECLIPFGVQEAQFHSNTVPDDKKCVYKCIYEKAGIMNSTGEITLNNFRARNPQATQLIAYIEACAPITKKMEYCDTGKALADCLKQKYKPA